MGRRSMAIAIAPPGDPPSASSDDPLRHMIARHLREQRRRAGMTIPEAARLLGVTDRTIERCERGTHVPRADLYLRAMRVYGVDGNLDAGHDGG